MPPVPDGLDPRLDRFCQLIVPPEDLAEMSGWLALLIAFIEGKPPPASVKQPQVRHKLRVYAHVVCLAARAFADGSASAPAAPVPVVLGPAQLPPASELITTAQAADLAGYTAEWWRRLAVAGKIPGRKDTRRAWLLDRAAVVAYGERRRRGDRDGRQDRFPGRAAGGSPGCGD